MNKQLNISVFGLKLTTIDELKRIIERILPETYSVNWTNINDARLDVLLISHLFYDLPNIVSIREQSHLKTLKIAHDPVLQSTVLENTLYLPIEEKAIELWFKQTVFADAIRSVTSALTSTNSKNKQAQATEQSNHSQSDTIKNFLKQMQATKDIQPSITTATPRAHHLNTDSITPTPTPTPKLKPLEQTVTTPHIPTKNIFDKSRLAETLFQTEVHYKYFEKLQQKLWHQSDYRQCILMAGDSKIALIDKPNNQFWLANHLPPLQQTNIQLQHADLNDVVHFFYKNHPYDLQQGLWNLVWQNAESNLPSYNGYYRLKYWPQPLQHHNQREIFKIAAYLQNGAHLNDIHKHSGIPLKLIYRFVFTGLMSDCVESIHEQDADPRFKDKHAESNSTLRNFFGKLRKKLGL